jgi:quinol monooxygenase YgiN
MSEVNLIATIPVAADVRDQVARLLSDYGHDVRAEPGNLRFELYLDADAGALVVVERYRDQAAFADHLARPENAAFNSELARVTNGGASRLQMLEFLD